MRITHSRSVKLALLRRQPPVHSPLTLPALARGARHALRLPPDPRPRLAELLRRRFHAQGAVLYGSGTEALEVALRIAEQIVGRSAPVALPAFSCFDVASAAVAVEARISLYDIEPSTLGPDLDSLGRRLAEGARVVVLAPLYGVPIDFDAMERILRPYDAVAIEDAAQGQGAEWCGRPLGALGPLSVLSFGRGKGWTGGRGGVLLLGRRCPVIGTADVGRDAPWSSEFKAVLTASAQWALGRPETYALPAALPWLGLGESRYRDAPPPSRMSRAAAALIEGTLAAADCQAALRRANGEVLLAGISFGHHVQPVRPPEGGSAGFLRLPVRLSRGLAGFDDRRRALRLGVAPSYPAPLGALGPVQARLAWPRSDCPGAEELAQRLVTLPTHSFLTPREREELLHLINTYAP